MVLKSLCCKFVVQKIQVEKNSDHPTSYQLFRKAYLPVELYNLLRAQYRIHHKKVLR